MKLQRLRPLARLAAIFACVVLVIACQERGSGTPSNNDSKGTGTGGKPAASSPGSGRTGGEASEAEALLVKLTGIKKDGTAIPQDLKIAADRFIEATQVPYKTRIGLALVAFDERSATKQVEIIFREIAKRPFETITELFPLVPEGPMQDRVADAIGQVVSITAGDAPQAVAWLESLPASPRKEAVSIIAFRLDHAGDVETLRSFEKNSKQEDLKKSFRWWVEEAEKKKGLRQ